MIIILMHVLTAFALYMLRNVYLILMIIRRFIKNTMRKNIREFNLDHLVYTQIGIEIKPIWFVIGCQYKLKLQFIIK